MYRFTAGEDVFGIGYHINFSEIVFLKWFDTDETIAVVTSKSEFKCALSYYIHTPTETLIKNKEVFLIKVDDIVKSIDIGANIIKSKLDAYCNQQPFNSKCAP